MNDKEWVVSRLLLVSLVLIAAGWLGVVVQAVAGSGNENSERLLGELTIFDPFTLTSSVYPAESSSASNASGDVALGSEPDEEPFLRLQSPIRIPFRPKCRSPFRPPWWVPGPPPWNPGSPPWPPGSPPWNP